MICENCSANVPKIYEGSDGRKYCCAGCIFHPLGCRCKFGEFGIVEDDFYDDEEIDEDFEDELGADDPSVCNACLDSLDQFGQCICCNY